MSRRAHPNVLVVEGKEDLLVVAELLEASGVPWVVGQEPVEIEPAGSIDDIFRKGFLQATLKRSGVKACGILVDADADAGRRWSQLRAILLETYPNLPEGLPKEGLIHSEGPDVPTIGAWIMPDNLSAGMLESILLSSRIGSEALNAHASSSIDTARNLGACWRDVHRDKAELHTWLAWQDPPGCQMHIAVRKKWLVPSAVEAGAFVRWATELFGLAEDSGAT